MSTTKVAKCQACMGQKYNYPLGFMKQECSTCQGVGFVDVEGDRVKPVSFDTEPVQPVKQLHHASKEYKRLKALGLPVVQI